MPARKPWSQACENNKDPILDVLREMFADVHHVLEIGSGTGQHAVHFAAEMQHLRWQPTDRPEHLPGIEAWRLDASLPNLLPALELDVTAPDWPISATEAVFSANTAHIMSWAMVEHFFAGVGRLLPPRAPFCLYGPFNVGGQYTSPSNADFDRWLQQQDPRQGIRDREALEALGARCGLTLESEHLLPANNRLLAWRRLDRE